MALSVVALGPALGPPDGAVSNASAERIIECRAALTGGVPFV
jgi:hypothetical protein